MLTCLNYPNCYCSVLFFISAKVNNWLLWRWYGWLFEDLEDSDEYINWLQVHTQLQARLLELWQKTSRRRLTFIHEETPSLDDRWQQWPRYTDKGGYALVWVTSIIHLLKCIFFNSITTWNQFNSVTYIRAESVTDTETAVFKKGNRKKAMIPKSCCLQQCQS